MAPTAGTPFVVVRRVIGGLVTTRFGQDHASAVRIEKRRRHAVSEMAPLSEDSVSIHFKWRGNRSQLPHRREFQVCNRYRSNGQVNSAPGKMPESLSIPAQFNEDREVSVGGPIWVETGT